MENNYSVYQHVTPDGMYYFGATNDIKRRWRNNGAGYKETSLYPYIEKYGWDNIQHIVLFKDQTKENALWIEDFLITTAQEDGVCINKKRSGNISKEEGYKQDYDKHYYKKNKNKKNQYHEQYYEENKEKIKEYGKKYYETNKNKRSEQMKQYYEKNRDEILEQKKQYYEQNREKILEYHREYQRQYRKRKKLEKQFKEVETTLF